MSLTSSQVQSTEPSEVQQVVRFVGGTTAVTKLFGRGVTVTYISTGVVDLTWADSQGAFLGIVGWSFDATAPAGVKGFTVQAGDFNTATRTLRLNITSAADALVDLSASQRLSIRPSFKTFNV